MRARVLHWRLGVFMVVRIRFPRGRLLRRQLGKNRQTALALSALLTPISLMSYVLGFWSLGSDIGLAREFGIAGVFSHWQVWIGLAVGFHAGGRTLAHYGSGGTWKLPRVLSSFPRRPPSPPTEESPPERKRA